MYSILCSNIVGLLYTIFFLSTLGLHVGNSAVAQPRSFSFYFFDLFFSIA